jgi:deazaflavin-dependent oxidoreductase (nitroreductase family)
MRIIDRLMTAALRVGVGARSSALLETTGRRSGRRRLTPVTNGLDRDRFWIVTEHGMHANYVRNLLAEPHVRVKAGGRWRRGEAHLVEEDPQARLQKITECNPRARTNANIVRRTGTDLRVICIDLE